jgi:hypothetical protein
MRPDTSVLARPRTLGITCLVITTLFLAACDSRAPQSPEAAKRLQDIAAETYEKLDTLKKAQCRDDAAQSRLAALAVELGARHATAPDTAHLLRTMMDSGCLTLQNTVIVEARALRPMTEGKAPSNDILQLLTTGLSSTDAKLRYQAAMTAYELRADPRGTAIAEKLGTIAANDPDDRARQTATWVREQLAKLYPSK